MNNPTKEALVKEAIRKLTKEEFSLMLREAKEKEPQIEKKLEELRLKLVPEMLAVESMAVNALGARPEKKVLLKTVSEIIDIPVNELVLHFLNNVKTKNERSLIEYHMGQVHFFAC